jgi:DNA-binding transcriptional ArsR family regulator
MADNESTSPQIIWDIGTAYDLFASLEVLHFPAKFGLRGAWAAGVRSRLSQEEREFFEKVFEVLPVPFAWVYGLPDPKDASTALYTLKKIPPIERFSSVILKAMKEDSAYYQQLAEVQARGSWGEEDKSHLLSIFRNEMENEAWRMSPKQIEVVLGFAADTQAFGEQYLEGLQSYYDVFFAEEEQRIEPKLDEALENAYKLAESLSQVDLFEELSRGVRYEELPEIDELVLVPSYWFSPLVSYSYVSKNTMLWLFGARPAGEPLVPGEIVPEDLVQALKALADPTRLKIMSYLTREQLTPAELSRRLRLRAPTVTHHLHTLRLAGLVRFVIKGKQERLYFARLESVKQVYAMLKEFLEAEVDEVENVDVLERRRAF